jgi:hypothetical protein
MKIADTVLSVVMLTVQLPVPLQPPPYQPQKTTPVLGVAVNLTDVL